MLIQLRMCALFFLFSNQAFGSLYSPACGNSPSSSSIYDHEHHRQQKQYWNDDDEWRRQASAIMWSLFAVSLTQKQSNRTQLSLLACSSTSKRNGASHQAILFIWPKLMPKENNFLWDPRWWHGMEHDLKQSWPRLALVINQTTANKYKWITTRIKIANKQNMESRPWLIAHGYTWMERISLSVIHTLQTQTHMWYACCYSIVGWHDKRSGETSFICWINSTIASMAIS